MLSTLRYPLGIFLHILKYEVKDNGPILGRHDRTQSKWWMRKKILTIQTSANVLLGRSLLLAVNYLAFSFIKSEEFAFPHLHRYRAYSRRTKCSTICFPKAARVLRPNMKVVERLDWLHVHSSTRDADMTKARDFIEEIEDLQWMTFRNSVSLAWERNISSFRSYPFWRERKEKFEVSISWIIRVYTRPL